MPPVRELAATRHAQSVFDELVKQIENMPLLAQAVTGVVTAVELKASQDEAGLIDGLLHFIGDNIVIDDGFANELVNEIESMFEQQVNSQLKPAVAKDVLDSFVSVDIYVNNQLVY